MLTFDYLIKDVDGIHARPAGALIQCTSKFKSDIQLSVNGKSISLKSGIFALMGLGIKCSSTISFSIDGADELEAKEAIIKCLDEFN